MNAPREPRADVAPAATETLYTVQDVARLTGARVDQLRRWAKSGLLPARRQDGSGLWYGFPDLIAARTAVDLIDRGVTTRQVREAIEVVRAWRPDLSQPLASLRVYSDHGRLVVRLDDALVEPRSGQAVLALPLGELAEAAQRVGEVVPVEPTPRPLDAEGWVARGLDAETAEDLDEAAACYARALALEPEHPGALLNLGNVAYQSGQLREACEHYRAATQADPDYAEGWYNLANVLDDLGHLDAAARCYDAALDLAPEFADAHFNLALLWEKSGARERARTHWARFLELVSEGDSADLARSFLAAREDEG